MHEIRLATGPTSCPQDFHPSSILEFHINSSLVSAWDFTMEFQTLSNSSKPTRNSDTPIIPLSWWRAPTCQSTPSLSAKEHLRRPMTLEGKRLCKNRLYRCTCRWPRLHITEPAHILQQSDAEWLRVIKSLSNWDEIKTTSYFLTVGEPMTIPTFYAFHKKHLSLLGDKWITPVEILKIQIP